MLDEAREKSLELRKSPRVAIIAIMSALTLVGSYAIPFPNLELGSSLLFITSFVFGGEIGAICTLIVSAVYFGLLNPWGAAIPLLLLTQVIGWLLFVTIGHLMGKAGIEAFRPYELAIVGGVLTLLYDLLTNLGWAWTTSTPYFVVLVGGALFMVVHVSSNFLIFGLVVPHMDRAIRGQLGPSLFSANSKMAAHQQEIGAS
jgi:hypothetical protein